MSRSLASCWTLPSALQVCLALAKLRGSNSRRRLKNLDHASCANALLADTVAAVPQGKAQAASHCPKYFSLPKGSYVVFFGVMCYFSGRDSSILPYMLPKKELHTRVWVVTSLAELHLEASCKMVWSSCRL